MSSRRFPRLAALLALVGALFVAVVAPVGAAGPTLAANPTQVAFSSAPGQPGTTQITVSSNDQTDYSICVSDNGKTAQFIQGVTDQSTVSIPFPFIQAGSYRFFLANAGGCGREIGGTSATVQRRGPTGAVGVDDLLVTPNGDLSISPTTSFPQGGQVCFMSGDGGQKGLNILFGQDPRATLPGGDPGLATTAIDTTVSGAVVGQNGCYPFNAINTGFYRFTYGSAAQQSIGFCSGANAPDIKALPFPIARCAQVAYRANAGANVTGAATISEIHDSTPSGTRVTGAALTGIDTHAIEVCFAVFAPSSTSETSIVTVPNTVNAYNASGAVQLTPLTLNYAGNSVALLTTYDITNPGQPGGVGGAQFACPDIGATQAGGANTPITSITTDSGGPPNVGTATVIDARVFRIG